MSLKKIKALNGGYFLKKTIYTIISYNILFSVLTFWAESGVDGRDSGGFSFLILMFGITFSATFHVIFLAFFTNLKTGKNSIEKKENLLLLTEISGLILACNILGVFIDGIIILTLVDIFLT